jgi:hypothetical protein
MALALLVDVVEGGVQLLTGDGQQAGGGKVCRLLHGFLFIFLSGLRNGAEEQGPLVQVTPPPPL